MKKLILGFCLFGLMIVNASAYSELDCNKDALQALRKSGLLSVYLKAVESVEGGTDTAKGMVLGIQNTTDTTIQNALKTYCKLQAAAVKY